MSRDVALGKPKRKVRMPRGGTRVECIIRVSGLGSMRISGPTREAANAAAQAAIVTSRLPAATHDATIAAVRAAVKAHAGRLEAVIIEVDGARAWPPYTPAELALARTAAERRGEPDAPITGNRLVDFAGIMAHIPDDEWADYEADLRRMREEDVAEEPTP